MDLITREAITLSIALLGAALGLINLWRAIDRDRVRVRVTPLSYINTGGASGICLEVVNVGLTAVTISSVGFVLRDGQQLVPLSSTFTCRDGLPHRLESREAITAYLPAGIEKNAKFGQVKCAYAKTACGLRFRGTSKSLRHYVREAR